MRMHLGFYGGLSRMKETIVAGELFERERKRSVPARYHIIRPRFLTPVAHSTITYGVLSFSSGDGPGANECQEAARWALRAKTCYFTDPVNQSYNSNTPTTKTAYNNWLRELATSNKIQRNTSMYFNRRASSIYHTQAPKLFQNRLCQRPIAYHFEQACVRHTRPS